MIPGKCKKQLVKSEEEKERTPAFFTAAQENLQPALNPKRPSRSPPPQATTRHYAHQHYVTTPYLDQTTPVAELVDHSLPHFVESANRRQCPDLQRV